jgi:hypothetical protein
MDSQAGRRRFAPRLPLHSARAQLNRTLCLEQRVVASWPTKTHPDWYSSGHFVLVQHRRRCLNYDGRRDRIALRVLGAAFRLVRREVLVSGMPFRSDRG